MVFFFQAEDGIRDLVRSRGLGDVYKRQALLREGGHLFVVDAVKTTDNDYAERVVSARFGAVEHEQMRPVGGTNHRVVKTYHTQDSLVDAASRAALRLEEFQSGAFFFSAQLTPISTGSRST